MNTTEKLDTLKAGSEPLNKKIIELTDDALQHVSGGQSELGTLDRILMELTACLDAHPNATKSDIYCILQEKKNEYADMLTIDELSALNELMNSFAS